MRSPKPTELDSASAKGSDSWIGEVAIVGEPLEAAGSSGDWSLAGDGWEAIAIGSWTARKRSGLVRCAGNGHREAGAECDDGADRPTSNNGVRYLIRAA